MHNKHVVGENFFKISKILVCIASFCVTTWYSLGFSNVPSFLRSGPIKSIHEISRDQKERGFFQIMLFLLFSVVPWDFFFLWSLFRSNWVGFQGYLPAITLHISHSLSQKWCRNFSTKFPFPTTHLPIYSLQSTYI